MTPKRVGCCSICNAEVFHVLRRDAQRLPIAVSYPHDDAMRATFVLADGTQMDLTLCKPCTETLTPEQYGALWQRVMASWVAESGRDHPFVKTQGNNAIIGLLHAVPWKEVPA